MADEFEDAYSGLRAQILARHFFLSRYARADHFDMEAHLGDPGPLEPDNREASPGGIVWHRPQIAPPLRRLPDGSLVGIPARDLYENADDLQSKLRAGVLSEIERWRWAKHDRTNSLLMTGIRLSCLAIEARLGNTDSLKVIDRILNTLEVLFKFSSNPTFQGYVVRWDAVASDMWETRVVGGQTKLRQNYEFLLNADKKTWAEGHTYLYCTPFNDARYIQANAKGGVDRYRRWEPSMDEYVGLVTGYYMITFALSETPEGWRRDAVELREQILTKVRTQADRIGRYFKQTGYFIVRPCGGFTFRGAIDINPCLEYPLARALAKITGNPTNAYFCGLSRTFERALDLAGYGPEYRAFNPSPADMGAAAGADVHSFWSEHNLPRDDFGQAVESLVASVVSSGPTEMLLFLTGWGKAAMFSERLDIYPEGRTMVALAWALNMTARRSPDGAKRVFNLWMKAKMGNGPSNAFKCLLALTSIHDPSDPVARGFCSQFDIFFANQPERGKTEMTTGVPYGSYVEARAARVWLAQNEVDAALQRQSLESELQEMLDSLKDTFDSQPPLTNVNLEDWAGVPGAPKGTVAERLDQRPSIIGFSLPLALAWLLCEKTGKEHFTAFQKPKRDSVEKWPAPAVPAKVVKAAREGKIVVPVDTAIQNHPLPDDRDRYFLLTDPPPRTREKDLGDPPAPVEAFLGILVPSSPARYSPLLPFLGRQERDLRLPLPARPADAADPNFFPAISSYEEVVSQNVEFTRPRIEDNAFVVTVRFKSSLFFVGAFQAKVSAAWVYTPNP
ncbi:MAG TPA: hypothetical protein VFX97_11920 [Pyrinomonadaceae bacterium]|nr:hypothetical protein [Pyrinomonadaceae bacterium]